jgi:8-oxo-dGTP pyrophosphatase MutT (NUDIX family)
MERQSTMAFAAGVWVFPGGGVAADDGADGRDPIVAAALRETEEETGVVLGADDIHLWDAWTTPAFEPRRYRTWFYVARLPEGQEARDISTESRTVAWLPARSVVGHAETGEMALMPPTYLNLLDIARHDTVADVFATARAREVTMFTPSLEELGNGYTLSMPPHLRPLRMARLAEG